MAFKAINNFIGPNGLIPILLVFRAYLYIVEFNISNPTVIKRVAITALASRVIMAWLSVRVCVSIDLTPKRHIYIPYLTYT
jgi:hypothetical protein